MKQQLASLIQSMGMETEAGAGDFAAIETAAHAQSVSRPKPGTVSMSDTLIALGPAADATILAFEATPTGRAGLAKLATKGLDYGHPLTVVQLSLMVEATLIPQSVSDILTDLSVSVSSPAEDVGVSADAVALDFEIAWITHLARTTLTDAIAASEVVRADSIADEQVILDAAQEAFKVAKAEAAVIHSPTLEKNTAVNAWLGIFEGTTASQWQAEVDDLMGSLDGNGSHNTEEV